jgi:transposase
VEGLLRLTNVLEATHGTLKNVNNICTLAINSAKYFVVIFNVRIWKDFGLKNSVFYIRTVLTEYKKFLCIFSFGVVEGLLRLTNVLEATHGTLKNVNNICTLAINSAKYFVLFSGDLTGIRRFQQNENPHH